MPLHSLKQAPALRDENFHVITVRHLPRMILHLGLGAFAGPSVPVAVRPHPCPNRPSESTVAPLNKNCAPDERATCRERERKRGGRPRDTRRPPAHQTDGRGRTLPTCALRAIAKARALNSLRLPHSSSSFSRSLLFLSRPPPPELPTSYISYTLGRVASRQR